MNRKFVMMPTFDEQWKSMGLNDDDLHILQNTLLDNPKIGSVIQGTGGLRKMRFAFPNRSKRDSCRVLYVDFVIAESIYLIYTYPKSEKSNLSKSERNHIKKLIERLEETI